MTEEKQYYWVDIESGVRFPCTKEYHDSMTKLWESVKPEFRPSVKIKHMVLYGTKGEDKNFTHDQFIAGINPISGEDSKVQWIPMPLEDVPDSVDSMKQIYEATGVPPKYTTKNGGKP